jgi:hypothetical protein
MGGGGLDIHDRRPQRKSEAGLGGQECELLSLAGVGTNPPLLGLWFPRALVARSPGLIPVTGVLHGRPH